MLYSMIVDCIRCIGRSGGSGRVGGRGGVKSIENEDYNGCADSPP